MSAERTIWLRDIYSISTVWTFFIRDESLKDIRRWVEPLLYTIDQESEYRYDDDWPEELHEKEKGRKYRDPSEENTEELMWYNIPKKKQKNLKQDQTISKSRYRKYNRMRTIDELVSHIELIEHCKYHPREEKWEHCDDKPIEKIRFSIALFCCICAKLQITYLGTILRF